MAQFRNALKHMLSVKHMSAYIEACAEAGSEYGLCKQINPFWKEAHIGAVLSLLSTSFPDNI